MEESWEESYIVSRENNGKIVKDLKAMNTSREAALNPARNPSRENSMKESRVGSLEEFLQEYLERAMEEF